MGTVFQPTYTYKGPNGERLRGQSKKWHIRYTDVSGRSRSRLGGLTERQARDALHKQESMVLDERNGLPSQRLGDMLVSDLADRYLAAVEGRVAPKTFQNLRSRIVTVLCDTRVSYLRDLTPELMEQQMLRMTERPVQKGPKRTAQSPLSTRSVNVHLQAMKQLLHWAVLARILPYSPLDCVQNLPEKPKHPRRPLELDEIPRLLTAALEGPTRRANCSYANRPRKDGTRKPANIPLRKQIELREDGRRIMAIYSLLIGTGLRVNELKSLQWKDVDLDAAIMRLSGAWTKNGKSEVLPLAPQVVAVLRDLHGSGEPLPGQPVVRITSRLARCFDEDLVAAGIPKVDAQGRVACLHSLRHTFGQLLNAAGTDPKTLQTLMRHSSPILSLSIYVHRDKNREREAVAGLPTLAPTQSNLVEGHCEEPSAKSS